MEYTTCLVLSVSSRTLEIISLWRGPERVMLEQEHKELLGLLMPHLKNALRIRHALGLSEDRARNAEAMLNASETASILLDGDGRIIHMKRSRPAHRHRLRRLLRSRRPHRPNRSLPSR